MKHFKITFLFTLSLICIYVPAASAGRITGTIRLSPELMHRVSPSDTVYIIAQAQFGPSQPLAMKRYRVRDLPIDFKIGNADAKVPGLNLSSYPEVRLIGWVTKSGFAYLERGDFKGTANNVRVGDRFVNIIINQIVR